MEGLFDQIIVFGKVVLAVLLGGVIGYEREVRNKPAGLRTHMLVAGASCAILLVGSHVLDSYINRENVMADPVRIIQAIILGIGFIGGGVVKSEGGEVKNITTAASILFVSILGITVALNQFVLAVLLSVLNVGINAGLLKLEQRISH